MSSSLTNDRAPAIAVQLDARILGTVMAIAGAGLMVSGRAAPFFLAAWLIAAVSIRASGDGWNWNWQWLSMPTAGKSIAALFAYAALTALWAVSPSQALSQPALGAVFLIGAIVIMRCLEREPADRLAFLAFWLVCGFGAGLAYLAFEVVTHQAFKIWLFNTFPFIEATNQRYYLREGGRIVVISPNDLNRSLTCLSLLLAPMLLCVSLVFSGQRRWIVSIGLLVLAFAAIFPSMHDTSKLAYVAGLLVFALAWYQPVAMHRLIMAGWTIAVLGALPLVFMAFNMDLHHARFVPLSAQDRIVIWKHTASETLKAPILGAGARTTYNTDEARAKTAKRLPDHRQPLHTARHAHNIYVQTWYELGAVGAILLCISGLFLLRGIAGLAPLAQPYALATFTAAMIIAAATWGMWQSWYMAAFALSAVCVNVGARLARLVEHDADRG